MKAEVYHKINPTFRAIKDKEIKKEDFKKVAVLDFPTNYDVDIILDAAFENTNTIQFVWWDEDKHPGHVHPEPGKHRSTSVGDVVVIDGQTFQADMVGWIKLDSF